MDYKKLKIYELAHQLAISVYILTEGYFPKTEQYGLISQIRRASTSISLNIVEGTGRTSKKELYSFLNIAFGSLKEVEELFNLAYDLSYLPKKEYDKYMLKIEELSKMLYSYKSKVQSEASNLRSGGC